MLTFRRATAADIPVLRELAERIWRAYYPSIIGADQVEYMLGWMYSHETMQRELSEGVVWELAETRNGPAGFFSISFEADDRAKLNKLYLIPELHGRGLGAQMIERACAIVAELGARELSLQVNKNNERAIRAYERAGFHRVHEAVFDIGSGFVMDDYVLAKPIINPA